MIEMPDDYEKLNEEVCRMRPEDRCLFCGNYTYYGLAEYSKKRVLKCMSCKKLQPNEITDSIRFNNLPEFNDDDRLDWIAYGSRLIQEFFQKVGR